MTHLYIDNQRMDTDGSLSLSISLSLAAVTSLTSAEVFPPLSLTIPKTAHNRTIMGDVEHPSSARMFNHTAHRARVEVDGCVVAEGLAKLTASISGSDACYRIEIVSRSRDWHKTATKPLSALMEDWCATLTATTLSESLSAHNPLVRFLPVERGSGTDKECYVGRVLHENYHPFIHIASLLRAVFAEAGYTIESEFVNSEFFRSLYMSGNWSRRNYGGWVANMDFKALRSEDSPEVAANAFGRVYASPLLHYNTIGNLVDLPDESAGGYNSGSLGVEESSGRLMFTPTTSLMVAFDYHLKWRTDYRILDRNRLQGFSTVRIRIGDEVGNLLPNTFKDYRNEDLSAGYDYNFVIFDHTEGATYRLLADEVVNGDADLSNLREGDTESRVLLTTQSRSTLFHHNLSGKLLNLRVAMVVDGVECSPASDWAVYSGAAGECGSTEVNASFRSQPIACTAGESVFFDDLLFEGGEQGMTMSLLSGSSITPVFYPYPTIGSEVVWSDVAAWDFSTLDLLVALQELFDLQILSEPTLKRVYIEPRNNLYDGEVIIDFSERIDLDRPIVVEELGDDCSQHLRFAYRSGDVAVEEYTEESGERYGEWVATIDNIFASEDERSVVNNLFTASLSQCGVVAAAPSAHLIVAKGSAKASVIQHLNSLPKIVSYRGMHPLPSGERWDYPTRNASSYPLLTFFDNGSLSGTPRSLLFEDRDGVEGLHRWWDRSIEQTNHSRRLRLNVYLLPSEVEQFVTTTFLKNDFRALYMLLYEGERVLCRLEEICDYDPSATSTAAVFVTV